MKDIIKKIKIMKKKQENQDKIKKIISTILLIIWCLLIFYLSSQNGNLSGESSSRVINFINKILKINLYNFKYSVFIVRKLAHMFLYFVLYLLSFIFFKSFNMKKYHLKAFVFCLLYAISDELHQLFIIERTFKLLDILIDMFGTSVCYFLIKTIGTNKHSKF